MELYQQFLNVTVCDRYWREKLRDPFICCHQRNFLECPNCNIGVTVVQLDGKGKVVSDKKELTAQERKERPIFSGVLKYFPDALLEVAHVSFVGNQQHNPGQPLHWAKEKSTDELDALTRHLLDAGKRDVDGTRHSAKIAWRALANLQREIEAERSAK